jgi:hypothetical protein
MLLLAAMARANPAPRLRTYVRELLGGIDDARRMASIYDELSGLTDGELAARGLVRHEIPHAVIRGVRAT